MSRSPSPSSPDRLAGVAHLSRLAGEHRALPELLATAAAEIAGILGYRTVCVNLHRPHAGVLDVVAIHGSAAVRAALEGTCSRWEDWTPLLDERFAHGDAYFVPEGSVDWTEQIQANYVPDLGDIDGQDAWRAEDALFVPLRRRDGELIGVVSVDEPASGKRPAEDELAALAAMATHVGYAIESSLTAAAEEARRSALERLLEVSSHASVHLRLEPALTSLCGAAAEHLGFGHVELAVPRAGRLICLACSSVGEGRLEAVPETAVIEADDPGAQLGRASAQAMALVLRDPGGRQVGVLLADEPGETPLSAGERKQLLRTFAGQAEALLLSAAHRALQSSEARKDAMLNASLDGILTFDRLGRIVEFNPAAEAIFRRPREAVLGRELAELVLAPARRAEARRALEQHLVDHRKGLRQRLELVGMRPDGTEFPCETTVVPTPGPDGERWFTAHVRDISDRVAAAAALREERDRARHDAVHDVLTGLLNRRGIEERLDELLAADHAPAGCVLAICIDLDDFAAVNETFGPTVGDRVLTRLAATLRTAAGDEALVARTGSDEFVVARYGDEADHRTLQGAVQAALDAPLAVAGATTLQVRAGIGLARAARRMEPHELLKRAKSALRRAKETQTGPAEFTPGLDRPGQHLAVVGGLRRALANDELELHYQPLYRLGGVRPYAFEALLRWRRDDGSFMPPAEFIPAAESSGLIEPVGEWVLHEACRQMSDWRAAGLPLSHVQVNVSPRQLRRGDLPDLVDDALRVQGLDPAALVIEVTETGMLASAAAATALSCLDDLGVRCALDDFGADYSSLSRLAALPVRAIKIDRAFLRGVPDDPGPTQVIAAIADFCRALGLHTVVEGVETPQQLAFLAHRGVDAVQGFLLGRPMPARDAAALFARPVDELLWGAVLGPGQAPPRVWRAQPPAAARETA